jgi:hypothetical protein
MTEIITIGRSEETAWRRNNLLAVRHCKDMGDYHEVSFQWIEHTFNGARQINLIYRIVK